VSRRCAGAARRRDSRWCLRGGPDFAPSHDELGALCCLPRNRAVHNVQAISRLPCAQQHSRHRRPQRKSATWPASSVDAPGNDPSLCWCADLCRRNPARQEPGAGHCGQRGLRGRQQRRPVPSWLEAEIPGRRAEHPAAVPAARSPARTAGRSMGLRSLQCAPAREPRFRRREACVARTQWPPRARPLRAHARQLAQFCLILTQFSSQLIDHSRCRAVQIFRARAVVAEPGPQRSALVSARSRQGLQSGKARHEAREIGHTAATTVCWSKISSDPACDTRWGLWRQGRSRFSRSYQASKAPREGQCGKCSGHRPINPANCASPLPTGAPVDNTW